jgi:hypothetical protein
MTHLAKAPNVKLNILGYMLSDLGDAGILHLLVSNHDKAFLFLKDKYKNRIAQKEVLIISVPHVPGQLLSLVTQLGKEKINIRTSYQCQSVSGQALIVLELNNEMDLSRAKTALEKIRANILAEQP